MIVAKVNGESSVVPVPQYWAETNYITTILILVPVLELDVY